MSPLPPSRAVITVVGLILLAGWGARTMRVAPAPSTLTPISYRLLIAPGGDPAAIHVDVDRAERLEIDADGDLMVSLNGRLMRHPRPRAYQEVQGVRREIGARFEFTAAGSLRLALDAYDRSQPLVIAPLF